MYNWKFQRNVVAKSNFVPGLFNCWLYIHCVQITPKTFSWNLYSHHQVSRAKIKKKKPSLLPKIYINLADQFLMKDFMNTKVYVCVLKSMFLFISITHFARCMRIYWIYNSNCPQPTHLRIWESAFDIPQSWRRLF